MPEAGGRATLGSGQGISPACSSCAAQLLQRIHCTPFGFWARRSSVISPGSSRFLPPLPRGLVAGDEQRQCGLKGVGGQQHAPSRSSALPPAAGSRQAARV
eukprot:11521541-Alexandrium_andersonii.AAC.1